MGMIKPTKIRPMFTAVVTTMDIYDEDVILDSGLIDTSKKRDTLKEYQTVVAIGGSDRDINVGDVVKVNPERFAEKKHQAGSLKDGIITDNPVINYRFNVVELGDTPYLLLQDRDIEYIVEEYDTIESNKSSLVVEDNNKLISPDTKIIH